MTPQLDPRTADRHEAAAEIQEITLAMLAAEVPSHLQPDSSTDLDAEDEYLAAGTGPLAGDTRGTES